MTAAADRARAEVQAPVAELLRKYEAWNGERDSEWASSPRQRSQLRAALNDTAALDRMLAEAKAEAWDEGFTEGALVYGGDPTANPYRAEGEGATDE